MLILVTVVVLIVEQDLKMSGLEAPKALLTLLCSSSAVTVGDSQKRHV
jgi:hypothetical protein